MAEYTIPKPYRDFYVTNPAVETLERVETLEKDALPNTEVKSGQSISGTNTLEGREIEVSVKNENLLVPFGSYNASTSNGVTFTPNSDNGITLSGTPTGGAIFTVKSGVAIVPNAIYSFGYTGEGQNVQLELNIYNEDSSILSISNKSGTLNAADYPTAKTITVNIKRISNNVEMSGTVYPYLRLVDGTKTTVYATGKNLFKSTLSYIHENTEAQINENNSITIGNNQTQIYAYTETYLQGLQPNTDYILSFDWNTENESLTNTVNLYKGRSGIEDFSQIEYITTSTPVMGENKGYIQFTTNSNPYNYAIRFYSVAGTYYENALITYSNIQLEKGTSITDYKPYHGQEIPCQVGDTINVEQYDGYTCITADNIHVTLSGEFTEKIEDLLNERPVILVGLFASRPTDTADYPRIYVATDKTDTDRTTLLQANQSGATASNWIYI